MNKKIKGNVNNKDTSCSPKGSDTLPTHGKRDKARSYSKKGPFVEEKRIPGSKRNPDFTSGNDFQFWNEYPELMSVAAKFPWLHIQGTKLQGNSTDISLPNVAVQHFVPVPGFQSGATSPLNLAFRQMYLDMHRRYRGIGTYQASDIAITILCIESVLQKIVEAERIYGILNYIPVRTRIQPYGLLAAMGYSTAFINDVNAHLADFRYGINRLVNLAKRLPLPNGMSFFLNHVALNGFVYADSKDDRADLLVFVCDKFFEYNTVGDMGCINNSGTAVFETFSRASFSTYSALLANIEASLYKLMYDSDILRITSDFIACYGESDMQVLLPIPEDYRIAPVYSESILNKWHNSEITGVIPNAYLANSSSTTQINVTEFAVYQENDIVFSMPMQVAAVSRSWNSLAVPGLGTKVVPHSAGTAVSFQVREHIVDTWEENPSIEVCCESVLWKNETTTLSPATNSYGILIQQFSTEIMTYIEFKAVVNSSVSQTQSHSNNSFMASNIGSAATTFAFMSHFDWHPYYYLDDRTSATAYTGKITRIVGDTDNCSLVTGDTISKIVDAALLSAFKVKVSPSGGSTN